MKRRFFWSVFFTVFFRLPIYESIAAIFWQSASSVLFVVFFCYLVIQSPNNKHKWLLDLLHLMDVSAV